MMLVGTLIIVGLLILQDFLMCYFLCAHLKDFYREIPDEKLPKISVLVPARNEEKLLADCLKALGELRYPKGKLEIILGDDRSSDGTAAILRSWVARTPDSKFLEVQAVYSHLNGKANALAQMAEKATGDLLLFTDADCQVNPGWAVEMVKAFRPAFGLLVGVTRIKSPFLIQRLQGMDWWLTLGMIKVTADLGRLLTAVGNNMLISREAYDAVGGFQSLPFSVTEDFSMGQAIAAKGYRPAHQVSSGSLVDTKAEKSFFDLMRQRKRWMRGAFSLALPWQLLLALQALFFPAVIATLFVDLWVGGVLWLAKVMLQAVFIWCLAKKAEVRVPFWELFIFEVYYLVISWSTIVYYFWPSKINWKEREY
ncbi:hydroxychlorobactene glucosyltransferase CruC [Echinicola sediminis]